MFNNINLCVGNKIDTMKLKPGLFFILFLFSCIYDPPQKGKEILIHNQTNKPIIILNSLNLKYLKLYDTAMVNERIYITRQPNYITGYSIYQNFFSDNELNDLKSKNISSVTFYIVDEAEVKNTLNAILNNHAYRSFDVNVDTLKKYQLNHLFITRMKCYLSMIIIILLSGNLNEILSAGVSGKPIEAV
jgi:hypothetical protein